MAEVTDDPKDPPDDEFDQDEYDEWWNGLSEEEEAALETGEDTIALHGFDPKTDPEFQEMLKEAKLKRGVEQLAKRLDSVGKP